MEAQTIIQGWVAAFGPYVLSGAVALLAFLGKRMIDKQDAQEKVTNELGIGYAALSERVQGHGDALKRHQKWLENHQEAIQEMKTGE
jgi:predicted transcriptional regulator